MHGFCTGRDANGPPYDGWNLQQLQMPHARSSHHQDMADHIRKRFWRNGTRRQKDWTKKYQLCLRDNTLEIPNIPKDRTVTYAQIVVKFCPQKADPHQIWITVGGNLINYPGKLSTCMADLTTSKLMWNSVLSTPGAKYMCLDIKKNYLTAPLDWFEYMKMPIGWFPQWIIEQYDLNKHVHNGFIYLEMQHAVWGLPLAGIFANKLLRKCCLPHGYFKCPNTPGSGSTNRTLLPSYW